VGQREKEKKKPIFGWAFAGIFLLTLLAAAGLLLLWAWVSYHMRFSAEFIRLGLLFLYILPCLTGGKMLAKTRCKSSFLWGAGLGAAFCGALLAVSRISAVVTQNEPKEPDWTAVLPLVLCVLSGMAGAIRPKKRMSNP
jgi:putative membrane protein (TIGR04086 family)